MVLAHYSNLSLYPVEATSPSDLVAKGLHLCAVLEWNYGQPMNLEFAATNRVVKPRPLLSPYVTVPRPESDNWAIKEDILIRPPAELGEREVLLLQIAAGKIGFGLYFDRLFMPDVVSVKPQDVELQIQLPSGELSEFNTSTTQLALAGLRVLAAPSIIRYSAQRS